MGKRSSIPWIIVIVGIALISLIGIQINWAQHAYALTEKDFAEKVTGAMNKTSTEINKELTCFEIFSKVRIDSLQGFYMLRQKWKDHKYLPVDKNSPDTVPMYYANTNSDLPFAWKDIKFSHPVEVSMLLEFQYLMGGEDTGHTSGNALENVTMQNFRDVFSERKPIEERYDPAMMDSFLRKNLNEVSILENYKFGYVRSDVHKLEYASKANASTALLKSPFHVALTNTEYFSRPYDLAIVFDDYSQLILAGIKKLLIISMIIILALLISFYLFVRIILKQRRLSELKNDFINNMTHEFKTPLTNISLAFENIAESSFNKSPQHEQVLKIIGQETERLKENIDRILQIARYEKEKLHLSLEQTDIHQLIQRVISAFENLYAQNGICFQCHLNATRFNFPADETHLFNMIYNIIDNGIKYNTNKPEIVITTEDSQHGITIRIKDNGVGISSTNQKRIFEKFYRVPKGNLHDVKGYGLGLSYVKLVVEAHHGTVRLHSQPGHGSEFEIYIPEKS